MNRQESIDTLQAKHEMLRQELKALAKALKAEPDAPTRKRLRQEILLAEMEMTTVTNALISLGQLPKGVD